MWVYGGVFSPSQLAASQNAGDWMTFDRAGWARLVHDTDVVSFVAPSFGSGEKKRERKGREGIDNFGRHDLERRSLSEKSLLREQR